ncbi:GINS complex subunit [Boothiomyces sp. JEL0866]|nr:GINS complex subunit [Boothiomyces sp. JEL0866]
MLASELDEILGIDPQNQIQQNIYELMKQALVNEIHSPELLSFQEELFLKLKEKLESQLSKAEDMQNSDQVDKMEHYITLQEIERIKFVLRKYIKTRIAKIEKYTLFYLMDPSEKFKMSLDEIVYAERFSEMVEKYHHDSFLKELPLHLQSLKEPEMIRKPNKDDAVFIRCLQDIGQVQSSLEESVEMSKDDIFMIRYSAISHLIFNNKVKLI